MGDERRDCKRVFKNQNEPKSKNGGRAGENVSNKFWLKRMIAIKHKTYFQAFHQARKSRRQLIAQICVSLQETVPFVRREKPIPGAWFWSGFVKDFHV